MRLPDPALGADSPINMLRELWAALDALQAAPGCSPRLRLLLGFLLSALARYDDEAAAGVGLDHALGLRRGGKPDPWWRRERLANRDRALREIVRRHYPDLDPTNAAAAVLRDVAVLDRQTDPPKGGATADLARAARYAEIPGSKRAIRDIINEIKTRK